MGADYASDWGSWVDGLSVLGSLAQSLIGVFLMSSVSLLNTRAWKYSHGKCSDVLVYGILSSVLFLVLFLLTDFSPL